jgi:hypothetical protein
MNIRGEITQYAWIAVMLLLFNCEWMMAHESELVGD